MSEQKWGLQFLSEVEDGTGAVVQVYTAEEKAALAMFNMEENKRKEQKILGDMQRLVQRTIGEADEEPQEEEEEEAQEQEAG